MTVSITDTNIVAVGNDFTVDDVALRTIPELSTWAMMLFGFGGLGFATYRRRQKAAPLA